MTREDALKSAKPILFNTEMVRAILNGRKTVTRRVVKPKYTNTEIEIDPKFGRAFETAGTLATTVEINSPYTVVDILYVRETWREIGGVSDREYIYRADDDMGTDKWYPSIYMPREAARIFLRVTNVRAERLQDISDEDMTRDFDCCPEAVSALGKSRLAEAVWNSTVKKSDLIDVPIKYFRFSFGSPRLRRGEPNRKL